MINNDDRKSKKILIKNLKDIVLNNIDNYDVYLSTFTFNDDFKNPSKTVIEEYFKSFFHSINQASLNKPSKNQHKKCFLICFPEISYKSPKPKKSNSLFFKKSELDNIKQPVDHYHGFLLIHKDNKTRFLNRAIMHTKLEYYEILEKNVTVLYLKQNLINCRRSQRKYYSFEKRSLIEDDKTPLTLRAFSVDLRFLETETDIERASKYITKNFMSDFLDEDALFFTDMSQKNRGKRKISKDINTHISS